jgi:hypothetical protein
MALFHIVLRGAELKRTAGNEWVWTENNVQFNFQSVSETSSEILIYDGSRDMYHRLDLTGGQTFWRQGTTGSWNAHYAIVKAE